MTDRTSTAGRVDGRRRAASTACASPSACSTAATRGTTMRVLAGLLAGPPVPLGAHRRRVAAQPADGARRRAAARRWARTSTARRRRTLRAADGPRRRPARHPPRARGRERAGEDRARARRAAGRRRPPRSSSRRRAATTPSGCSARSGAPIERSTAATCGSRAGRPEPFELDVPGDPSSAAFFVSRPRSRPARDLVLEDVQPQPGPDRVRRRAARMGARHRGRR